MQSSLAQGLAWIERETAPPASRELTPTTETEAWLKGSLPRPPRGQPTLPGPRHTLRDYPASLHMSPERP